jgi:hypothetical protein
MKKLITLVSIALILGLFVNAHSADNVSQTVTYEVQAINEISVSGNPGALVISTATAGSEPDAATDATTSYNVTTNGTNKRITGSIDTAMPANTSLLVTLTAPTGGSSAGQVTLSTTAQDLVTGISTLAESGLTISYGLTANASAGVVASSTKTVTLTVADGS